METDPVSLCHQIKDMTPKLWKSNLFLLSLKLIICKGIFSSLPLYFLLFFERTIVVYNVCGAMWLLARIPIHWYVQQLLCCSICLSTPLTILCFLNFWQKWMKCKGKKTPRFATLNTDLWLCLVLSQSPFTVHITCACKWPALFLPNIMSQIFFMMLNSLTSYQFLMMGFQTWYIKMLNFIMHSKTYINMAISHSVPRYRSWSPASRGSESWYFGSNEKND